MKVEVLDDSYKVTCSLKSRGIHKPPNLQPLFCSLFNTRPFPPCCVSITLRHGFVVSAVTRDSDFINLTRSSSYYDRERGYCDSNWDRWGRWVAFAVIVGTAFLLFLGFA